MNRMFGAAGVSAVYGATSYALIAWAEGPKASRAYLAAFVRSYDSFVSLALMLGTTFIVYRTQNLIPETIERAFAGEPDLWLSDYSMYRERFMSRQRSLMIVAVYMTIAFATFSVCRFGLSPIGNLSMLLCACVQYGLGVYVGRKLCYVGMMLHALLGVEVRKNLFQDRSLDLINLYVHIISSLTLIFVYVHMHGYYSGPFKYDTILGDAPRTLLILPVFVATPVLLLFNFYPRIVLRQLYSQSIDFEIKRLQTLIQNEDLTAFEKKSYVLEVDKMSRDELRYSLQLSLGDLPIGITLAVMLLQPLIGK